VWLCRSSRRRERPLSQQGACGRRAAAPPACDCSLPSVGVFLTGFSKQEAPECKSTTDGMLNVLARVWHAHTQVHVHAHARAAATGAGGVTRAFSGAGHACCCCQRLAAARRHTHDRSWQRAGCTHVSPGWRSAGAWPHGSRHPGHPEVWKGSCDGGAPGRSVPSADNRC
jgi:hypothetical protein